MHLPCIHFLCYKLIKMNDYSIWCKTIKHVMHKPFILRLSNIEHSFLEKVAIKHSSYRIYHYTEWDKWMHLFHYQNCVKRVCVRDQYALSCHNICPIYPCVSSISLLFSTVHRDNVQEVKHSWPLSITTLFCCILYMLGFGSFYCNSE